ncbi:hypothetical protein I4U23_012447 [Adineta vaga]|nr:hypothetical protein I4U23_012447 [Adineta vaga]
MIDDSSSEITCLSTSGLTSSDVENSNLNLPNSLKKSVKLIQVSSHNSQSSLASSTTSKTSIRPLNKYESAKFGQHIEQQYKALERSEMRYCYYIEDSKICFYAREQLKKAVDGTYFLRSATDSEQQSNILYVLCFVSHKETVDVPICYNEDRRSFYFLSSFGLGSEVTVEYNGIDLMISDKERNPFIGLQYPFQISLYRPIVLHSGVCIPLPDELRSLDREDNLLHDIASRGLTHYLNELILISQNYDHALREKAEYILNKINARNKQGLTPLILAIQGKKYNFIDMLIDNSVNTNIVDGQGCSPIHHACQQANYKILQRLIEAGADPHYFNRKQTTDERYLSNLSALHYLAMAKDATTTEIQRCAIILLLDCGCPLMSLTKDGKSPFDIAQMYENRTYECVKSFSDIYQFNSIIPVEVSSRSEAKSILRDYTCSNRIHILISRIKHCDNRDSIQNKGLFLFYRTKKTRSQSDEEYGLCVYYNKNVTVYPIIEEHMANITNLPKTPYESFYNYSLKTDTRIDDHIQVTVFRSYEELIYNYTRFKGILSTKLTYFIQKERGEWKRTNAADLILPPRVDIPEPTDLETAGSFDIDVRKIERIALSDIHLATIIDENRRRLIWLAKVQNSDDISFPIIIKDYLPKHDIDTYKSNRFKDFNSPPPYDGTLVEIEDEYEYNSRARLEYQNESKILLTTLKNHPFIIHAFECNRRVKRDLRIYMEYLPDGNLHSYLRKLNPKSIEPLIDAFHWIYQLAQVMAFLFTKKIVHRDLATRNLLLRNEQHIVLSDFGLSRSEGEVLKGKECVVSPCWAAPECFTREQKVSSSSDVWAFGVVIWEMFSFGSKPYEKETNINENTHSQQIVSILKKFLIQQGRRLTKPDSCSNGMYDLMCRCWNNDVSQRPSFFEIVEELNNNSMMKDRLKSFSKEEKQAWKDARSEYTLIKNSFSTDPNPSPGGYIDAAAFQSDFPGQSEAK